MDDKCRCGHWAMDHSEIGCENCMCERFAWPFDKEGTLSVYPKEAEDE